MTIATHRGTVCLHCFQAFTGTPDLHVAGCGETPEQARSEALARIEARYDAAIQEVRAHDALQAALLGGLPTQTLRRYLAEAMAARDALNDEQVPR